MVCWRATGLAVLVGGVLVGAGPGPVRAAPVAPSSALLRYRDAHAALAGGEYARAQALFEAFPEGFVLADYAALYAAESLLRAGQDGLALERLRAFPDRFPDSVLVPQALLASTDTAFRLARWAEAEREARRVLARVPNHPDAGRVLVRLAEARAAQGFVADAMSDLRRRWIDAPASGWGEAAREILEDLARLQGAPVSPLTPEEQLAQAQRLADAGEVAASIRQLDGLLDQSGDPAFRHRVLARIAPLMGRSQRGADAIPLLQAAVAEPATASRPALLYELARLLSRAGQPGAAVPVFEQLLAEFPDASLSPDAALSLARTRLDLHQPDAARVVLQRLLAAYPESQAAASARWELAWIEYRAGRFRDATLAFRQLSATGPSGRIGGLYWAARSLEAAGEKPAALALYREVQSRGPNTYYGFLVDQRVRGRGPAPVAPAVRLAADPVAALEPEPHYRKAEALQSVGFDGAAYTELEILGRDAIVESDRAWGLAAAFAQMGEAGRSLRYLRRAFGAAADGGAPGLSPRFWRLYYPLGFADIVKDAAQRVGLDSYFVAAVIREESSYDPRARSWVGAVGLMQLMPDTARLVAQDAGLSYTDPAGLWEPPVNIALGSRYLAQLRQRFQEPLLAVASYNAGPHRVQRWLADRGTADLEEFVDQIPFDETRAFVKRVYASWQHYRRLYGMGLGPPPRKG